MKTKQKLTLQFTVYFFLFLIILATLFIGIFRNMFTYTLRKDLTHEFKEVVTDHIGMDQKGIFFKKDKKGDTLRSHLFNDNVSALFTNDQGKVIRSYGVFESSISQKEMDSILAKINDAMNTNKVLETDLDWSRQSVISYISPLKYQGKNVGAMVLAKSLNGLSALTSISVIILAILGGFGLIGSFAMGYFFTQSSFRPLEEMIKKIEATDLNRLEHKMKVEGHPDDEFTVLAGKFNDMLHRLKTMSAAQKEFIANASHELKTPLTRAILSLDEAMDKEKNIEDLKDVKQDLFDIGDLIDTLLILGKVKEEQMPTGSSAVTKVIQAIIPLHQEKLEEKKMHFTLHLEESVILPLPFEYAKIVLTNLVSNAIKYSPNGTAITFESRKNEISVIDQGFGMDEEEKKRIFDRFYRGKLTRQTSKGYGLGLSLVKQICDLYKIKILVESQKGVGTSITLRPTNLI